MSRARTAVLVTLPLAAGAVALTLYAGPYWVDVVRHRVDEQRWPEQRARIEAAVDAVVLPDDYVPIDCPDRTWGGEGSRCWRTTLMPADVAADLGPALAAAGVEVQDVTVGPDLRGAPATAFATGELEGRSVLLGATRELDRTNLPETVFAATAVVELAADLVAP